MINNIGVSQTLLFNDIVNDLKKKILIFIIMDSVKVLLSTYIVKKSIIKHMDYNSYLPVQGLEIYENRFQIIIINYIIFLLIKMM